MEVIRGLHNLKPGHRGCVMTVGNFDGLHLGHQAVLAELGEDARRLNLPLLLMTFEPTPKEFFAPEQAPARLSTLGEKIELARRYGVDRMLCARFNADFAAQSPEAFVDNILIERLAPEVVMVGADFRYGARRAGDFDLLARMGQAAAPGQRFEARVMPTVLQDGVRVSSTGVRNALAEGQPEQAARLLGREYSMSGRVMAGQRLGRTLGVPTANLAVHRKAAPCYGVYATTVTMPNGDVLPAAASLGLRPTVNGEGCLLEVHILDYSGDLYGKKITVNFVSFLRPEQRFDDVGQLRYAMLQDIANVRKVLGAAVSGQSGETQ